MMDAQTYGETEPSTGEDFENLQGDAIGNFVYFGVSYVRKGQCEQTHGTHLHKQTSWEDMLLLMVENLRGQSILGKALG